MSAARAFLHPAMKRPNLDGAHQRARDRPRARRASGRSACASKGGPRRPGARGAGAARGDPLRRHLQLAAAAAALGHRAGGAAEVARHRGAPRAARRRREPARPLRAALRRPGQEHRHHQRAGARAEARRSRSSNWMFRRKGILGLVPTLVYAFWRSDPDVANSDIQITFTPASYREGVQGELEREPGHDGRLLAAAARQPRLRAAALVRSVRRADDPAELSRRGKRPARAAGRHEAGAPAARRRSRCSPTTTREDFPGPHVQSDDELLGAAKRARHHHVPSDRHLPHGAGDRSDWPSSTTSCACAASRACASIDASIMPTMLSANLNAATMMIADRASDFVRGRTSEEPIVLAS